MSRTLIDFNYDHLTTLSHDRSNRRGDIEVENRTIKVEFKFDIRVHTNDNDVLHFKSCVFEEQVNIDHQFFYGQLNFEDCIFLKDVQITNQHSNYEGCTFSGTSILTFSKKVILRHIKINDTFKIQGTSSTIDLKYFQGVKDSYKSEIQLYLPKLKNAYVSKILHCNLSMNDISEANIFLSYMRGSSLTIYQTKINRLEIKDISLDVVSLDNMSPNPSISCGIFRSYIKDFHYYLNSFKHLDAFSNTIGTVLFQGVSDKDSICKLSRTNISKLIFYGIHNNGFLYFSYIKNLKYVSFEDSSMGKSDFINCEIVNAETKFLNSKIIDCFFSETDLPKKFGPKSHKSKFTQERLAFGQMATAFQKQGDTVRQLEYSARELHAHYSNLKLTKKTFFDWSTLFLNYISNDFGRKWSRGIIFSLATAFLFFYLLLISTEEYQFNFPTFNIKLLPIFLKFMNPLRFYDLEALVKVDTIKTTFHLNAYSYLWDFLGRVFLAYGYYQTIQAFRRFGRK